MADEKETFPDRLDSYVSAVLDRMDFRPRDRYHPNSEYEKDRARRLRNIVYDLKAELEAENAELAAKLARAQAAVQFADNLIDSAESGLDYYEFRDQHAQAIREAKEAA